MRPETQLESWKSIQDRLGLMVGKVFAVLCQNPNGQTLCELEDKLGWYLKQSPASRLKRLPEDKKDPVLWSDQQIQMVINKLNDWAADPFYFIACLGLRPIEARQLAWRDVDLENARVLVYTKKGDGSKRSRVIPIDESLVLFLAEIKEKRKREFKARQNDHVFLNSSSRKLDRNALDKAVRRVARKMGIEGVPYGLRHSFITRGAENQENLEVIRKVAGHANLRTTENYLHIGDKVVREMVNRASNERKFRREKSGQ